MTKPQTEETEMAAETTIDRVEQLGYCEGYSSSAGVETDPWNQPGDPRNDASKSRLWRRGFGLGRNDQANQLDPRAEYWPLD